MFRNIYVPNIEGKKRIVTFDFGVKKIHYPMIVKSKKKFNQHSYH